MTLTDVNDRIPVVNFHDNREKLRPRSAAQQWCEFWGGRIQCENFEPMVSWKDPGPVRWCKKFPVLGTWRWVAEAVR
jgi:hypothetical protein